MLRLTRWRILNQLKRRAREAAVVHRPAADATGTATVDNLPNPASLNLDTVWDEEWQKNLLAAGLERVKRLVSPEQFQMFDLTVLEEWPVAKVTRALSVSAARVYLAKHRVGRLLRKEVRKLEIQAAKRAGWEEFPLA